MCARGFSRFQRKSNGVSRDETLCLLPHDPIDVLPVRGGPIPLHVFVEQIFGCVVEVVKRLQIMRVAKFDRKPRDSLENISKRARVPQCWGDDLGDIRHDRIGDAQFWWSNFLEGPIAKCADLEMIERRGQPREKQ